MTARTLALPLLRRLLAVYAILVIAAFAFPGGLVAWLDDRNGSGWLAAPLALARSVDAASSAIGVKAAGEALRKRFATLIGEDES